MEKSLKILLIGILGFTFFSCAATKTPMEIERDQSAHQQALEAIQDRNYVLEADQLQSKRGEVTNVLATTNFISVEDGQVTIQLAFNNGRSGLNSLGGITLEGNASNTQVNTDKRGNTLIQMNVLGAVLSAQVEITLYAGSNRAYAVVSPTFSGNKFTLYGFIYPLEESTIFKGRAI